MATATLLQLLVFSLVVIAPLVAIDVGTYYDFRNRVPHGGLIALVIGIPLAVALVLIRYSHPVCL